MKNSDKKEIIEQIMLMDAKYFLFDVIESEFIDKYFSVEISFEEYVIHKLH